MSVSDTMPVSIRPARPGDIPRMAELLEDLFSIERDFQPDVEKQVHGLASLVADPSRRSVVLAADRAGEVVGMITVQTLISTAEGGRVGLVEDVVVDRAFRGRGIGSRLLAEAAEWARRNGLKRLQLLADRENLPAVDFYIRRRWNGTGLVCFRQVL